MICMILDNYTERSQGFLQYNIYILIFLTWKIEIAEWL